MLKGRLGLETARVPHRDRHGLVWLSRGELAVRVGTLHFVTKGDGELVAGDYDLPYQMISCILLGPGASVTHDALRLLARHGTGLVAVGADGVRSYASMPFGPDRSEVSRAQVRHWADVHGARLAVARRMYELRLGESVPEAEITVLRGIEGHRVKEAYRSLASRYGITWKGRRYDRADPNATDKVNMAINHASVAVLAAAQTAVAVAGAIPQLGFIHEDSGISFCLDIADLYREEITLQGAFSALKAWEKTGGDLERTVRQTTGRLIRRERLISAMIDAIRGVLGLDDGGSDE